MVIETLYYMSATELCEARRYGGTYLVKDMIYCL
jgi:hypothetical protein